MVVNLNKTLKLNGGYSYESSIVNTGDGFVHLGHEIIYKKGAFLHVDKLDERGEFLWQKTYRLTKGFGGDIYSDGSFLEAYSYGDNGEFIGVLGNKSYESDCVLFKFDRNGDLVWVKSFNLDFDKEIKKFNLDFDKGESIWGWIKNIKPTEDGFIGYGIYGRRYVSKNGRTKVKDNALVLKLDQNGEPEWLKEYELTEVKGYIRDSIVPKSISSYAGGYYVVADLQEGEYYSPGTVMVLNIDDKGNLKWSKVLGYDSYSFKYVVSSDITNKNDLIVLATIDEWGERDRRYMIKGGKRFVRNFGVYTAYAFKLSQNGELQWSNRITTRGLTLLYPRFIKSIGDAVILGGTVEDEKGRKYAGLFKLDSENGNLEWQRVHKGKGKSGYLGLHSIDRAYENFVAVADVGNYNMWIFSFDDKGDIPKHQRKAPNINFEVRNDLIDRPQEIRDLSNKFNAALVVKDRDLDTLKITTGKSLELEQIQQEDTIIQQGNDMTL